MCLEIASGPYQRLREAQQSLATPSPSSEHPNAITAIISSRWVRSMTWTSVLPWFWLTNLPHPLHTSESFQNQTSLPLCPLPWLQFMCFPWNRFIRALTGLTQMGSDSSEPVEEAGLSSLSSLACWQCRGLEDSPVTLNYHHPCSTDAVAAHKR